MTVTKSLKPTGLAALAAGAMLALAACSPAAPDVHFIVCRHVLTSFEPVQHHSVGEPDGITRDIRNSGQDCRRVPRIADSGHARRHGDFQQPG